MGLERKSANVKLESNHFIDTPENYFRDFGTEGLKIAEQKKGSISDKNAVSYGGQISNQKTLYMSGASRPNDQKEDIIKLGKKEHTSIDKENCRQTTPRHL